MKVKIISVSLSPAAVSTLDTAASLTGLSRSAVVDRVMSTISDKTLLNLIKKSMNRGADDEVNDKK